MQNPFTTTFSKIPDDTYISIEQFDDIISNFSFEKPSESVYKITGVRGSGKTVLLAKVEGQMRSQEFQDRGWLVCSLSPARDMLQQFLSFLRKSEIVKDKPSKKSVNVSASIVGIGGSVELSSDEEKYFDVGVEIDGILERISKAKKKILIGIDEVSNSKEMIVFASEFGKWLREEYPVHMVCTGLYENIEQLSNVKNLTFFRRATTIKTKPLNYVKMSEMYRNKLGVDTVIAKQLAQMTGGYAYAFQELGVLCFKNKYKDPSDAEGELRSELYAYAYEKIWEEMAEGDRDLVRLISDRDEYKREEVLVKMKNPQNYSVYRDRLIRRGIINARQGYIGLSLPYFGDYVREYCIRV